MTEPDEEKVKACSDELIQLKGKYGYRVLRRASNRYLNAIAQQKKLQKEIKEKGEALKELKSKLEEV